MCKAHSRVTHIKQQKYFRHLKGRGYNKDCVSTALEVILAVLCVSLCYGPYTLL